MASSEHCQGIFDYAAILATGLGAQILVASIINSRDIAAVRQVADMGYEVDGENYVSDIKKIRKQEIDAILSHSKIPLERVQSVIAVGNPVDELLKLTVKESVDMVVMGTKGRTDLKHIVMGSVAEKLFRRSPVTVVSYRDEAQAEKLRKHLHL
jgi:nucleotide-binding universal stress UspA family protein